VNAGAEGNSLAPRPAAGAPPRVEGMVNSRGNVRWRTVQGVSEQAHSAGPCMKTTTEASRTHWSHRIGPVDGEKDGRKLLHLDHFQGGIPLPFRPRPRHGTCDAGAGVACLMQSLRRRRWH
jgi:hypothetical protein